MRKVHVIFDHPSYMKKAQISCRVTTQLISTFVLATSIVHNLYFLNPKFQASSHLLWLFLAWFVLDLVGNPEDRLSHDTAQLPQDHAVTS